MYMTQTSKVMEEEVVVLRGALATAYSRYSRQLFVLVPTVTSCMYSSMSSIIHRVVGLQVQHSSDNTVDRINSDPVR
jgi:hypothetical protein